MEYNAAMNEEILDAADGEKEDFKFEKPLRRILIACSIILAGELMWLFVVSPCMPLNAVDIRGLDGITRMTILERAGIDSRSSFMSVNAAAAEAALSSIPLIGAVEVIKHFPDTIEIIITNRVPVAAAAVDIDSRTLPVFFDKNGVLFQIGGRDGRALYDALPILSGLAFENVTTGLRLPEFLLPLFGEMETLRVNTPELLSTISEIHISKKKYDAYELTVYPVYNPVKIHIGQHINEDNLRYMLLLLDVLNEKGMALGELDFRTGTASYKVRETLDGQE
ncbi:MAG: FtsQ-type POTRA domain-containing protein [Spirochaetaceae bacterium]|jgi:cell division protein FtsQ|nr:FtsQ-type POTRA domain-containing protein [Spirochaetaceae bacterium]